MSVDNAVPVLAGNVLAVHSMVTFGGQVMMGAVLSSTKIVCTQDELLPHASVATQVRVIVFSFMQEPATDTSVCVTTGPVSQLSVAVAFPVVAGVELAVHWIVVFGGHVIMGDVLSSTRII